MTSTNSSRIGLPVGRAPPHSAACVARRQTPHGIRRLGVVTSDATTPVHSLEVGDSGDRVVFLHGLFGQGRNFSTIAKALEPKFRSLLVDLPNHGRSAWTEDF